MFLFSGEFLVLATSSVGVLPRNDWCDDILTKLSIAIVAAMPAKPSRDPSHIIEPAKMLFQANFMPAYTGADKFSAKSFLPVVSYPSTTKSTACVILYIIHSFLGAYTYSTQYNISRHRNNGSVNIRAYIYPGKKNQKTERMIAKRKQKV